MEVNFIWQKMLLICTASWQQWVTWAFLATNFCSALAYIGQIRSAWQCQHGAQAVSMMAWSYFALARLTGTVYAIWVIADFSMAVVFSTNFFLCSVLLAVIVGKRVGYAGVRL